MLQASVVPTHVWQCLGRQRLESDPTRPGDLLVVVRRGPPVEQPPQHPSPALCPLNRAGRGKGVGLRWIAPIGVAPTLKFTSSGLPCHWHSGAALLIGLRSHRSPPEKQRG